MEEPPPRLQTSAAMAFDPIVAGESASWQLAITNAGGGVLEGRLSVSAPWRLAQAGYRLAAGETKNIAVFFQPNEGRAFVGQITLAGDDGSQNTIALEGTATSPVPLQFEKSYTPPAREEKTPRAPGTVFPNELARSAFNHASPIRAGRHSPRCIVAFAINSSCQDHPVGVDARA